jgi:hypothetical protein
MLLCSRNWSGFVFACCLLGLAGGSVQAQQPGFHGSFPRNGSENIVRNVFISVILDLPNGPLDQRHLDEEHIMLFPHDQPEAAVPVFITFIPDLRNLVVEPYALLEPNTTYRFEITEGITDQNGEALEPYSFTFTTGTQAYRKLVSMDRSFGSEGEWEEPIDHSGMDLPPPAMRKALKKPVPKPEKEPEPRKPKRSRQELLALVLTFYQGVKVPAEVKPAPVAAPEAPPLPVGSHRELPFSFAMLDQVWAAAEQNQALPEEVTARLEPKAKEPQQAKASAAPRPTLTALPGPPASPVSSPDPSVQRLVIALRQSEKEPWLALEAAQEPSSASVGQSRRPIGKVESIPFASLASPVFSSPFQLPARPDPPMWEQADRLLALAAQEEDAASDAPAPLSFAGLGSQYVAEVPKLRLPEAEPLPRINFEGTEPDWQAADRLLALAAQEEEAASDSPTPLSFAGLGSEYVAEVPKLRLPEAEPLPRINFEGTEPDWQAADRLLALAAQEEEAASDSPAPLSFAGLGSEYVAEVPKLRLPEAEPLAEITSKPLAGNWQTADSLLWAIAASETLSEVEAMAAAADSLLAASRQVVAGGSGDQEKNEDVQLELMPLDEKAGEQLVLRDEDKAGRIGIAQTAIFQGKHVLVDFELPRREFVSFVLKDPKGRVYRTEGGYVEAGPKSRAVLLTDVPPGTYFAEIETIHQKLVRKITILD